VKGSPILNDATMEDAKEAGLTYIVNVIDNGNDAPGTLVHECSPSFVRTLESADMIISKGQGNYETLSRWCSARKNRNVYFLLKAKCRVIARHLGVEEGGIILMKGEKNAELPQ
jgi:damage-control phosphatase, subfamily I